MGSATASIEQVLNAPPSAADQGADLRAALAQVSAQLAQVSARLDRAEANRPTAFVFDPEDRRTVQLVLRLLAVERCRSVIRTTLPAPVLEQCITDLLAGELSDAHVLRRIQDQGHQPDDNALYRFAKAVRKAYTRAIYIVLSQSTEKPAGAGENPGSADAQDDTPQPTDLAVRTAKRLRENGRCHLARTLSIKMLTWAVADLLTCPTNTGPARQRLELKIGQFVNPRHMYDLSREVQIAARTDAEYLRRLRASKSAQRRRRKPSRGA